MLEDFSEDFFVHQPIVMLDFLTHHMFYALDTKMCEKGITYKQSKILVYLFLNKNNETKQTDLEKFFRLRPPTISSMVSTLEKNEWILRIQNEFDCRSKILSLSPKGVEILDFLTTEMRKTENYFLHGLDQTEQETFKVLLNKICDTYILKGKRKDSTE